MQQAKLYMSLTKNIFNAEVNQMLNIFLKNFKVHSAETSISTNYTLAPMTCAAQQFPTRYKH